MIERRTQGRTAWDRPGRPNAPRRTAGVALIAVLLLGTALLALAGMAATMAALHGAAARHELQVQRVRADAEAGLLWTQALLTEAVTGGAPAEAPVLPSVDGTALELVAFEAHEDGSVTFEVAASRPPVRVVVGGRWTPP